MDRYGLVGKFNLALGAMEKKSEHKDNDKEGGRSSGGRSRGSRHSPEMKRGVWM